MLKSLAPTQTNKNLTPNAIKGFLIPSWSLTRVRSDRDDKIIFWYFYDKDWNIKIAK